jgi:hypothetical protein
LLPLRKIAYSLFYGMKEKVTPFGNLHILSTKWKSGVEGNMEDGIDIIIPHRDKPLEGSFLSSM